MGSHTSGGNLHIKTHCHSGMLVWHTCAHIHTCTKKTHYGACDGEPAALSCSSDTYNNYEPLILIAWIKYTVKSL